MRYLLALALAMTFASSSDAQPSSAQLKTGNDFIEFCDPNKPSTARLTCIAYVRGLVDAFRLSSDTCPPDGVTVQQMMEIARKAIQDNPQKRHEWIAFLIWESWFDAFPCPKKSG